MNFKLEMEITDQDVIEVLSNLGYTNFQEVNGSGPGWFEKYIQCQEPDSDKVVKAYMAFDKLLSERLKKFMFKELFYIER